MSNIATVIGRNVLKLKYGVEAITLIQRSYIIDLLKSSRASIVDAPAIALRLYGSTTPLVRKLLTIEN